MRHQLSESSISRKKTNILCVLLVLVAAIALVLALNTSRSYAAALVNVSTEITTFDLNEQEINEVGGTVDLHEEGGDPSGKSSGQFESGTHLHATITPKAGYFVERVTVEGIPENEWFWNGNYDVPHDGTLSLTASADCTVKAHFKKLITRVDVTVDYPKCGTEIVKDLDRESYIKQTPEPKITVKDGQGCTVATTYNYDDDRAIPAWTKAIIDTIWYETDNLFSGKLDTGSTCYVKFCLEANSEGVDDDTRVYNEFDWTYDDEKFNGEIYVNGKKADAVLAYWDLVVYAKVDVQHDWDEGKVTKEATATAEGVKTYTCKGCGAQKTEAIPAKGGSDAASERPVLASMTSKGARAMTFKWKKVSGAAGYDIYMSRCNHGGAKHTPKKVKTIKGNKTVKWTKKGLRKGVPYKGYVKAYKMVNGKKKYIGQSLLMHAYTNGGTGKFTNPKSVKVSKSGVSLKVGKTYTIKATVQKLKAGKTLIDRSHTAKLRYTSSNTKVAKVDAKGKVTAKAKGNAVIYVQTVNGIWKTCKVAVK